jgi:hypothetical protein
MVAFPTLLSLHVNDLCLLRPDVLALLGRLLPLLGGGEQLSGNLWIVQENGIRIREGSDS